MFKAIIKLFIPSEKKLAKMAAESIAKTVNSTTAEREDTVAKIASMADKFTQWQAFVTMLLVDGRISDDEVEEIAEKLEPLMAYLKGLV